MSQLITAVPLPLAASIIFPAMTSSLVVPAVRHLSSSARPVAQRRQSCARPHPLARIDMAANRHLMGRKYVAAIQVPAFQRTATVVTMGIPDKKEQEMVTTHFKVSDKAHPLSIEKAKADGKEETWDNPMGPSVWTKDEVASVKITHLPAKDTVSTLAYGLAQAMRHTFDLLAGFKTRTPNEDMFLTRIVFLETVAAVPGMVAAMLRHLHSLRRMERDHGWIHTLLEEAENERMHLLTFIKMKQPGIMFRASVLVVQGALFNILFFAYLIKPKFCHRLVGYIEEEAVKTYTSIIDSIDAGKLPGFKTQPVPKIAIDYWRLGPDASFRDLILAVRADEANHRLVNHTFASIDPDAYNPFMSKKKVIDDSVEVPNKH